MFFAFLYNLGKVRAWYAWFLWSYSVSKRRFTAWILNKIGCDFHTSTFLGWVGYLVGHDSISVEVHTSSEIKTYRMKACMKTSCHTWGDMFEEINIRELHNVIVLFQSHLFFWLVNAYTLLLFLRLIRMTEHIFEPGTQEKNTGVCQQSNINGFNHIGPQWRRTTKLRW